MITKIKQNILFLIFVIFLIMIYFFYKIDNLEKQKIEGFDASQDAAITTAVKQIYLADVEAIRLLSNFAIQLSQGGTTIPGKVNFSGRVGFAGKDADDLPANWGGGVRTLDVFADGTIAVGTNKTPAISMTSDAYLNFPNGGIVKSGGRLHITGNEYLYLLPKNGVIISQAWQGNGNLTVEGNLNVGGTITCKGINIVDANNNIVSKIDSSGNLIFSRTSQVQKGIYWANKDGTNGSSIYDDDDLKINTDDNIWVNANLNMNKNNYLNIGDYWSIYEDKTFNRFNVSMKTKKSGTDYRKNYSFNSGSDWKLQICNIKDSASDYINNGNLVEGVCN